MRFLLLSILFGFLSGCLTAQVNLRVTVTSGSSSTTCTDGFLGGGPEPHWRVNIAGQGWMTYPQAGICFTNPPNVQYNEVFNCPSSYPAQLQVCIRAFEDDGGACIVSESCLVNSCQNFATPAPGASISYSLSVGGSSTATVNFTISATGSWPPGSAYDQICNAINLGTINSNTSIGNSALSNYGNFCASDAGDPEPWGGGNEQGVWFRFTTGPSPAAEMELELLSDPQGFGNGIDLQVALYQSSNGACNGALTLIQDEHDGLGTIWDETMYVSCLEPNTTYFLLVDGNEQLVPWGGGEGFFGVEIIDDGIQQAADVICDAVNLGTIPNGGSVSTGPLNQSNICATNTGDPNPANWGGDQTVWFLFQAPPSGSVFVDANADLPFPIGTDAVDLQIAVYGTSTGLCTGVFLEQESDYTPGLFDEDMEVRCLTPGENYWVLVDGSALNVAGIFDVTISDLGEYPATNDYICDAIPLGQPAVGGTVGLANEDNYCANNLFEPIPSNWANDHGVWYTFVAPTSGVVEITLDNGPITSDNIDLQVAVYDSDDMTCTGNLSEIASEHDGIGIVWGEDMTVSCLIPGRTYYLFVDGEGTVIDPDLNIGDFDISVYGVPQDPAGVNDLACDAIALGDPTGGSVGTVPNPLNPSQNNYCADAAAEPQPSGWTADQTVWYTFIAPATGSANIEMISDDILTGDPINLQFALYEATTCTGPFLEIASGEGLIYDIDYDVWCLIPGDVYYLQVDGAPPALLGGDEGYFDLNITEIPPLPTPPNDALCDAIALGDPWLAPLSINNQFNICADNLGDPSPTAFGTNNTVWYSFTTPVAGGPFAVDIDATSDLPWPIGIDAVDLQIAVYSSSDNSCSGSLTEVNSDYDLLDLFNESIYVPCLEEGMTYFVMIDGSALNPMGYFDLDIAPATATPIPTNDDLCDFIALGTVPVGGNINTGNDYSNFCADTESGEPSPFGIDQTVWFSFEAPNHIGPYATSDVTINVNSDPNGLGDAIDLQMAVYQSDNGSCSGNLSLVEDGSSDPALSFDAGVSITCLTPGDTYFVQVDGSALNTEGYFTITLTDDGSGQSMPYNDLCQAENLGIVPNGGAINAGTNYQNLCMDLESGESVPSAFGIEHTAWFTFTAPTSGNITVNAYNDPNNLGDDVDLQLALYFSSNNTCSGTLVEVDSDYDPLNFDESLTLDCLVPNGIYFLQVDGADGLLGDPDGYFTVEIIDDGGVSNAPYNNDICNAYDFGTAGVTQSLLSETNDCANVQVAEPGLGSYSSHTVWYEFTAPISGQVEINVTSTDVLFGLDPEVYLYGSSNNSCNGTMSLIESSSWPTALITETISTNCLIPGEQYFIQVDGQLLVTEGSFDIDIQDIEPLYGTGSPGDVEPPNNDCLNATPLTVQAESCYSGSGVVSVENYGEPTFTDAGLCGDNCGDTWYSFTMPSSGSAGVESNDDDINGPLGDFSTLNIVAYTGSCPTLSQLDCFQGGLGNDAGGNISAPPGSTVYLQVFSDEGADDNEDFEICISEGCGFDDCLSAVAYPAASGVPYCFNTVTAGGESVSTGASGYEDCGENDDPENSIYFSFTTDSLGSDVTIEIVNASVNGNCILGVTPTDAFNVSLYEDQTPCDNNPDALVDCQNFTACDPQPINWTNTYTGLDSNTTYTIVIDGGFAGTGGDSQGEIIITGTNNLGADLIVFSGERVARTSVLKWQTNHEENNDYFTIRRSVDGVNFSAIGEIDGAGTSWQTQYYELVDQSPINGINYYRLYQTDFDGTQSYLGLVSVDHSGELGGILIIPNPINDSPIVQIMNGQEEMAEMRVLDGRGRVIDVQTLDLVDGTTSVPLDAINYQMGVYFVQVTKASGDLFLKFVKSTE